MARKRMIDPQMWSSEDYSQLSMFARLLWVGLISQADDAGRGKLNPAYIKSQLFPYDEKLALKTIDNALAEIEKTMSVKFYKAEGKKYYELTNWRRFQTINKPTPSQIPSYSNTITERVSDHYGSATVVVGDDYCPNRKEIEKKVEIKGEENINTRTHDSLSNTLTLEDILSACQELAPVLFKRHTKNPSADYKLGQMLEELGGTTTLDQIKALLAHASKTYIVKPKYTTLDLIWVLNNQKQVLSANGDETTPQQLNKVQRDYDSED